MLDGETKFGVGQPVARLEDDRFLRGAGRYVDDIRFEGQLYAAFARSPYAHGVITEIDLAAARAAPGVVAVYSHADAAAFGLQPIGNMAPLKNADGTPIAPIKQPHLAEGRVRFVGQPVAIVIAESAAAAKDAAGLVVLDVDELDPVVDARDARADGAPMLHDAAPGNLSYRYETGDRAATDAAFAGADVIVSAEVVNQRVIVAAMEPRALNVRYDSAEDRWEIHCATQGAHAMRGRIADHLGLPPEKLRVITPDVGGGFGMKLMVHPEYAVVTAAARALGRPVKWTADRSESFLSDAQGRDLLTTAEAAFSKDGALLAMRARSWSNLGAYYSQVGAAVHAMFSAPLLGGMYKLNAAFHEVEGAFTNTPPTDAYRGAGRPEVIYVTERLIEAGARALDMDPAEIRLKNLLQAADMPYAAPAGAGTYDSGDCAGTLRKALAAADYDGRASRRDALQAQGLLHGAGVTYYMERTGGGPVENARLRISADGVIDAFIGTQSTGQGHETAWTQLICSALGVAPQSVRFGPGDSDALKAGGGTGGSRSAIMAHRVFALASDDVIAKGRELAAEELEAAAGDIEYSVADGGRFRIAGTDRFIGLFDLAARAPDGAIIGEGGVTDRQSTFPNGAHVAEVAIDPRTGWPRLIAYTIVDDFGMVINPLLVAGQVHGGVAQGVGQAMFEHAMFDPATGQPLNGSFMDYQLPRAADFPEFRFELTFDAPTRTNPMGVKGCGEAGAVAGIPAATLAILDALRAAGAPDVETPLTPLKIWSVLRPG